MQAMQADSSDSLSISLNEFVLRFAQQRGQANPDHCTKIQKPLSRTRICRPLLRGLRLANGALPAIPLGPGLQAGFGFPRRFQNFRRFVEPLASLVQQRQRFVESASLNQPPRLYDDLLHLAAPLLRVRILVRDRDGMREITSSGRVVTFGRVATNDVVVKAFALRR